MIQRFVRAVIMAALAVVAGIILSPFVSGLLEGFCPMPGKCIGADNAFFAVFGAAALLAATAVVLLVAAAVRGALWSSHANDMAYLLAGRSAMVCLAFNVFVGMMLHMAGFNLAGLPTFAMAVAATLIPLMLPDWFLGWVRGNDAADNGDNGDNGDHDDDGSNGPGGIGAV